MDCLENFDFQCRPNKSHPDGKRIMPETRVTDLKVGISRSASEPDV